MKPCIFVDSQESVLEFSKTALSYNKAFVHVIFNTDRKHPNHCLNNSLVYGIIFFDITYDQYYWIDWMCFKQNAFINDLIRKFNALYTLDLTNVYGLWKDSIDLSFLYYNKTGKSIDYSNYVPSIIKRFTNEFNNTDINQRIVPDIKHVEYIQNIINAGLIFPTVHATEMYPPKCFCGIEFNGIPIDSDEFIRKFDKKYLIDNNRVYTHHNLFTSTGRPSSRFGGINYAALNKDTGVRKIISAQPGKTLIEIDFKAYHPHIIADLLDYEFGDVGVYEHIAQYLYNTKNPTADQISKSKIGTFVQLYKTIDSEFLQVPFFAKVSQYVSEISKLSEIKLPSGKILQFGADFSPEKKFNYIIQWLETARNIDVILKYMESPFNDHTIPVLYTYDAVLFETSAAEITTNPSFLNMFTDNGKFPISLSIGGNYSQLNHIY